jgi:hypothetical protein
VAVLVGDAVAFARIPRHVTLHAEGALGREIGPLQAFVEAKRGLEFHKRVDIRVVDQKELAGQPELRSDEEKEARDQSLVLVALGLADSVESIRKAGDLVAESTLGRYDPDGRQLLVQRGPIDDFARSVLVHELTHALDDQRFDLGRNTTPFPDEADLSFRALVEGNATYVEEAYLEAHPQGRRDDSAEPLPEGIPIKLLAIASYPYAAGLNFVTALHDRGGSDEVNRAFEHPPTTSEQVLHPERYLRGEGPRAFQRPQPDNDDVVDRGVLGELILRLMIGEPSDPVAVAAGEGWAGDRYVAWRAGGEVCLRAHIVMDTPNDERELRQALQGWASTHPGSIITGSPGLVVLRRCVH